MTDILYRWPEAAKFGRRVPKEKFYEHGAVSPTVREKFVSELACITWDYKLAESTINLPGTSAVPEVQVLTLDAKTDDVGEAVLNAIDRAIPFPVIFEITRSIADRLATVRGLEREIAALERKLRTEPQFNRKVELRRTLKTKQHELEQQR